MIHRPPLLRAPSISALAGLVASAIPGGLCAAGPVSTPWAVNGPDDTSAVGCAAVAGWYATADSYEDNVEIRDAKGALLRTISRAEILNQLPWMSLDGSEDGPDALAFTDSGRLLFIGVHDALSAGDGQPSDAILRYDTQTGTLSVFARLEISATNGPWPHNALAHFKGRLYAGISGGVRVYRAQMNDLAGTELSFAPGVPGSMVTGLTIDRVQGDLYAWWDGQLRRAAIGSGPLTFATVGALPNIRALAYSDHFGGSANPGLYALEQAASPALPRLWFIAPAQARGQQAFAPTAYLNGASQWHDLAATADGALLAAADEDAVWITDSTDTRLAYDAWLADEFAQVVAFGKGLVSPDGEPPGWVIDADVQLGWTRFHPATPDGAAWVILLLVMNDHLNGDPQALPLVRSILRRHAGLSSDGIAPQRSADGIYRHWIDPSTGGVKPGWDPEYATMSTMKIVLAAARAAGFYAGDAEVWQAARAIICGVSGWDSYIQSGSDAMYLKALGGGGPDPFSAAGAFHEGIIFVEQSAAYGSAYSQGAYGRWLDRSRWPTATLVAGRPVTGNVANVHLPAFVSLYPRLLIADYRASAAWHTQVRHLQLSNMAWTDDNGPRYNTVFSAGTTKSEWGGYHADSLSGHPGDLTTLTSLMCLSAGTTASGGATAPAVAAYNAYRRGARQTFLGGASILYRRSAVDPSYTPNSAGLPDVALGALGLAELLAPGSVSAVLTGPYPSCGCPVDFNGDGFVDGIDYDDFNNAFEAGAWTADFNGDGFVDGIDYDDFNNAFAVGC